MKNAKKRLAVVSVALSARRSSLLPTTQGGGKPVISTSRASVVSLRSASGRIQVSAIEPNATAQSKLTTYRKLVRMVLLHGLADADIRREIFGTPDIDSRTLADTIAIIDSKETATRALSCPLVSRAAATRSRTHGRQARQRQDVQERVRCRHSPVRKRPRASQSSHSVSTAGGRTGCDGAKDLLRPSH